MFSIALMCLICACKGGKQTSAQEGVGGYLDSNYVSKTYRASMDSIQRSSGITPADFKQLQGFMRDYRDSIAGHPTYRQLLESAQGIKAMQEGIGLHMESMSFITVQKIVEVRLVMTIDNKMDKALGKLRGNIGWLDEKGKQVASSPSFSVVGPVPSQGSVSHLRLEYVLYKATGNELNDPRQQANRDTLEMLEIIAKRKDLSSFRLNVQDFQLANGLRPQQYWLMPIAERAHHEDKPAIKNSDRMPLLKWADLHELWLQKLATNGSPYSLMLSPVLTERVEASHGKNLILDRVGKVHAFFAGQKHIPSANINDGTRGKRLVFEEIIDFWDWPMELRIYQQI